MTESTYLQDNARELERMRALIARLGSDDLALPVNESWTVAAVLAHIAFWDARVLALADKLKSGRSFTESDDEPEDADWVNDSTRPFLHAIPVDRAARLALEISEETDAVVAGLSPALAVKAYPLDPDSPLNLFRADHRGEHLDEIERALAG